MALADVLPGTVLGTIVIQMVQAGQVFTGIDLYIRPLVMTGIIFPAVFIDSMRIMQLRKVRRRHIMKREESAETSAAEPIPETPRGDSTLVSQDPDTRFLLPAVKNGMRNYAIMPLGVC